MRYLLLLLAVALVLSLPAAFIANTFGELSGALSGI